MLDEFSNHMQRKFKKKDMARRTKFLEVNLICLKSHATGLN